MQRYRVLLPILLVVGVLVVSACSVSLPQGANGSIALIPFWDEEKRIQGVRPLDDWSEEAMLIQDAIPLTSTDAMHLLLADTDLTAMPESTGRYTGKAFAWYLYTFETHVQGVSVSAVRVNLAVAEDGPTTYVIALVVLPATYDTNLALFDTVFIHALYALEPME